MERRGDGHDLACVTSQRGNPLKWVYLTVAALSAGVVVGNFIPLFSQKLAGLSPLIAGFLDAAFSLASVIAQLFAVSFKSENGRCRGRKTL